MVPVRRNRGAPQRRGPLNDGALRVFLDPGPHLAEFVRHHGDAIRLLVTKLVRISHVGFAVGLGREYEEDGELVDHPNDRGAGDFCRFELARPHQKIADRFGAQQPPIFNNQIGAHSLQHLQQPRAGGVQAKALYANLRAGQQQRGSQHERGRGEVPGDFEVEAGEWAFKGRNLNPSLRLMQPDAQAAEKELRVITRGTGLTECGWSFSRQGRQQERGLDLSG